MKITSKIVATLACMFCMQVNAALIVQDIDVEVIDGPKMGALGTITVEYDDTLITGVGDETIDNPDFDLTLDLFGQIFTSADDIEFPGLPSLSFTDGTISFIDFIIAEASFVPPNPTDILDPMIGSINGGDVIVNPTNGGLIWEVTTEGPLAVPEPSAIVLFSLALGIVGFRRRNR